MRFLLRVLGTTPQSFLPGKSKTASPLPLAPPLHHFHRSRVQKDQQVGPEFIYAFSAKIGAKKADYFYNALYGFPVSEIPKNDLHIFTFYHIAKPIALFYLHFLHFWATHRSVNNETN